MWVARLSGSLAMFNMVKLDTLRIETEIKAKYSTATAEQFWQT
jgi:hypothetical protein